jgi:hypothetical protein
MVQDILHVDANGLRRGLKASLFCRCVACRTWSQGKNCVITLAVSLDHAQQLTTEAMGCAHDARQVRQRTNCCSLE